MAAASSSNATSIYKRLYSRYLFTTGFMPMKSLETLELMPNTRCVTCCELADTIDYMQPANRHFPIVSMGNRCDWPCISAQLVNLNSNYGRYSFATPYGFMYFDDLHSDTKFYTVPNE